jgi:hypothetical protein
MAEYFVVNSNFSVLRIFDNHTFPKFLGIHNRYTTDVEDEDFKNDMKVLSNLNLRQQYYFAFIAKFKRQFNPDQFNYEEVMSLFKKNCDVCNHFRFIMGCLV